MKKKRIIVLGFMGGCPVAGVIWQHLHYIVGLQRLGYEVWYVEDGSRYPYDPEAFTITEDFSYAARMLERLSQGRTVLLVSHELAGLEWVDRVVSLDAPSVTQVTA